MIPVQPRSIGAYVSSTAKNVLPYGTVVRYYLSWEDAMWDIIQYKKLSGVALVPEFWCPDVVKNMAAHGMTCRYYHMDKHFKTSETHLKNAIALHKPSIIIVFNALGIRNKLLEGKWVSQLPQKIILIEDSVHSIIDTKTIALKRKNHFIIDSWRKVIPLQGSALYGNISDITWSSPPYFQSLLYRSSVYILWELFQAALHVNGALAEMFMKIGYEMIGNSLRSAPASKKHIELYKQRDIEHITTIKQEQVELYEKGLQQFFQNSHVFPIPYTPLDKGNLRGFPVGLEKSHALEILTRLRSHGITVRFELNDSPWSKRYKLILLPLGPHLSHDHIMRVMGILAL